MNGPSAPGDVGYRAFSLVDDADNGTELLDAFAIALGELATAAAQSAYSVGRVRRVDDASTKAVDARDAIENRVYELANALANTREALRVETERGDVAEHELEKVRAQLDAINNPPFLQPDASRSASYEHRDD